LAASATASAEYRDQAPAARLRRLQRREHLDASGVYA
jgi:hypothetical protein